MADRDHQRRFVALWRSLGSNDHGDRRFHILGMVRVMLSRGSLGSLIAAVFLLVAGNAVAATCAVTSIPLQYNSGGSTVNLDVVDDGTGSGNCRLSGDIGSIGGARAALDPCAMYPHSYPAVRLAAAGTYVIAGVALKNTYICQANFPPQGVAVSMAIVEGTGTNCATISRALFGGTTATTGAGISISNGFESGDATGAVMATTTAGDSICIISSAALSGSLVTVQE